MEMRKVTTTYLDEKEMDAECWETARQLDVFDFGVDLGRAGELLVLLQNLLFDFVALLIGRRQEGRETEREQDEKP